MSNKITFSDLVERIAEETGASKRVIHGLFKEMVAVSKEGLLRDGHVYITGLGTFKLKWRHARQGINPQTGEPIVIPAQNRVYFKPEAALRRFINREYSLKKPEIIGVDMEPAPSMPKSKVSFFRRKRAIFGLSAALVALLLLLLVARFSLFRPAYESAPPLVETTQPETIHRYKIPEEKETAKEEPGKAAMEPDLSTAPETVPTSGIPEEQAIEKEEPGKAAMEPELVPEPETVPTQSISEEQAIEKEEPGKAAMEPDLSTAPAGIPGGVHDVRAGNSLWGIAESFYTDPYLWPNIFRVNTDVVRNPDVLEVGLVIHVPSLEGTIASLSKNDIVNIVDGYMQAYLAYRRLGKSNARYYLWVANQYNMPHVLQKYEDNIDESDRDFVLQIKGSPRI
jgi:nucleoid DNA-binding protein